MKYLLISVTDQSHEPAYNLCLQCFSSALFSLHQYFEHDDRLEEDVVGFFLNKFVHQVSQNAIFL